MEADPLIHHPLYLSLKKEQELTMLVTFREYEQQLIDQNSFEVSVAADVLETDYQFQAREDFRVRMPDVKFEVQILCC